MKITYIDYHNTSWIVKQKKYEPTLKQKTASNVGYLLVKDKVKKEDLGKISKEIREIIKNNHIVRISIHEKTKQFIIRVLDADTKQVIREIPWEKFLDLIVAMEKVFERFHRRK